MTDAAVLQCWPRKRLLDDARYGAVHALRLAGVSQTDIASVLAISESVVCCALRDPVPPSARPRAPKRKRPCRALQNRRAATKAALLKRTHVNGEKKMFKSGRPPKDPKWERPFTVLTVKMVRFPTGSLRRAARQLDEDGVQTSKSTVHRDRKALGLEIYTRPCTPLLTDTNKLERVRLFTPWAKKKVDDPIFLTLIFSDEKLFDVDHHGSKLQYRDPTHTDRVEPRLFAGQGGAKVMVFGAIGIGWRKLIILPEGSIDSKKYIECCLRPLLRKLKRPDVTFMQDGARIHTSKETFTYLAKHNVSIMNWAAHSPDANGIELIWARLAPAVSERGPLGRDQLIKFIEEEWAKIPQDYVDSLVMRFHPACVRIVAANGEIV